MIGDQSEEFLKTKKKQRKLTKFENMIKKTQHAERMVLKYTNSCNILTKLLLLLLFVMPMPMPMLMLYMNSKKNKMDIKLHHNHIIMMIIINASFTQIAALLLMPGQARPGYNNIIIIMLLKCNIHTNIYREINFSAFIALICALHPTTTR